MDPIIILFLTIIVLIPSWLYAAYEEKYFVKGMRIFVTAEHLLRNRKPEGELTFYLSSEDVVLALKRGKDPTLLFPHRIQASLRQAIDENRLHSGHGYL